MAMATNLPLACFKDLVVCFRTVGFVSSPTWFRSRAARSRSFGLTDGRGDTPNLPAGQRRVQV